MNQVQCGELVRKTAKPSVFHIYAIYDNMMRNLFLQHLICRNKSRPYMNALNQCEHGSIRATRGASLFFDVAGRVDVFHMWVGSAPFTWRLHLASLHCVTFARHVMRRCVSTLCSIRGARHVDVGSGSVRFLTAEMFFNCGSDVARPLVLVCFSRLVYMSAGFSRFSAYGFDTRCAST